MQIDQNQNFKVLFVVNLNYLFAVAKSSEKVADKRALKIIRVQDAAIYVLTMTDQLVSIVVFLSFLINKLLSWL